MTSSASVVLALLLAAGPSGPESRSDESQVPEALAARLVERIAAEWGAPASAITLSLGILPAGPPLAADAAIRLSGTGAGGWFVVRLGDGSHATLLRVRASIDEDLPVAARVIAAGKELAADDIRLERRRHWGPPAHRGRAAAEPGWVARRGVGEGERLVPPAVTPLGWVEVGGPVQLSWARGAIHIALEGTALNAAGDGETVRARVPGRMAVVQGMMTAPGRATLNVERAR